MSSNRSWFRSAIVSVVGVGVVGLLAGTTVLAMAATEPDQERIPPTRVTE